jgi:hypothetical protein
MKLTVYIPHSLTPLQLNRRQEEEGEVPKNLKRLAISLTAKTTDQTRQGKPKWMKT